MIVKAGEVAVSTIALRDARTQVGLTQRELAALAHVHYNAISACENGRAMLRLTAYALLDAINEKRKARGWEPLTIDQIAWKLRG
jgi:DNA-binding transcriptional regulator YiaG